MTEPMTKASLLEKLRTEHEAFEAVLAPLSEAQITTPGRFPWLGDATNRRSHSNAVA